MAANDIRGIEDGNFSRFKCRIDIDITRDQATESEPTQFIVFIFWLEILGPK